MPTIASGNGSEKANICEHSQQYFNRFQFFFDPVNIRKQAGLDRRFLQRLYREQSHANVTNFYRIDCTEEELPIRFNEIYRTQLNLLSGDSVRLYQLLINTLTHYYSSLTWSTSVPKCVIEFLENYLLKDFHNNLDEHSLAELEVICLIELFLWRYGAEIDEENVFHILTSIRRKAGYAHLASFVNGTVISHFGYSMESRLRRLCERLDLKVKVYRNDPFANSTSAALSSKRRLSHIAAFELEQEEGSSEMTRSSSEGSPQSAIEKGGESSSEEGEEEEELAEEDEVKPTPQTLRPAERSVNRKGSTSTSTLKNKQSPMKKSKFVLDDLEESSSTSNSRRASNATKCIPSTPRVCQPQKSLGKNRFSNVKPEKAVVTEDETVKQIAKRPRKGEAQSGTTAITRAASLLLSAELLAKYKSRMRAVKREQRTNGEQIFYGRAHVRWGLFELGNSNCPGSPTSSTIVAATSNQTNSSKQGPGLSSSMSTDRKQQQKNRSGRFISQQQTTATGSGLSNGISSNKVDDSLVYIAHTLLNVHNRNPLKAFKPVLVRKSAQQQMRIQKHRNGTVGPNNNNNNDDEQQQMMMLMRHRRRKLLKQAGRSVRKRMDKFRNKCNKLRKMEQQQEGAADNAVETAVN